MTQDRELAACPLLPCPWCGESLREVSVSEGSTFRWRKVDGCCTDGPEVRHNTMADDQAAAEVESRQRAIDAWNRRTPAGEDARDAAWRAEVDRFVGPAALAYLRQQFDAAMEKDRGT